MRRRTFLWAGIAPVLAILGAGCGSEPTAAAKAKSSSGTGTNAESATAKTAPAGEFRVLCSFFPIYVFTKGVVGDAAGVKVSLMLPASKGCPHGYDSLTTGDGKKIADADIFVLNGGGLEEFTEKKIRTFNPKIVLADSAKGLKLLDSECHHEEGEEHEHHHHHESGKNPHCFTSPILAAKQVTNIAESLATADPTRAETYRKNAKAYAGRLEALGKELKDALAKVANKKIVCSHEIFAYLAADAGLEVVGEVSSNDGAKGTPPKKLIEKIKKEKAAVVLTEPQFEPKAAQMIAKEAGIAAHQLDPLATGPDDPPADHYEKTMRQNIDVLVKALGGKAGG